MCRPGGGRSSRQLELAPTGNSHSSLVPAHCGGVAPPCRAGRPKETVDNLYPPQLHNLAHRWEDGFRGYEENLSVTSF